VPFDLEALARELGVAPRTTRPAPARQEGPPPQAHAAVAATEEKEAKNALQDGAEACRKPSAAPARQEAAPARPDPHQALDLEARALLRSREAEVAARAKGWDLVERIRALDWEQGQEFSRRLNRCPTRELPGLLRELEEVLAALEAKRGGAHGR